MSDGVIDAILSDLTDAQLERLADLLAPRILERLDLAPGAADPWLDSNAAATYLGASRSRVHDLVAQGALRAGRDGRRLKFRRGELDRYLAGGER